MNLNDDAWWMLSYKLEIWFLYGVLNLQSGCPPTTVLNSVGNFYQRLNSYIGSSCSKLPRLNLSFWFSILDTSTIVNLPQLHSDLRIYDHLSRRKKFETMISHKKSISCLNEVEKNFLRDLSRPFFVLSPPLLIRIHVEIISSILVI